MRSSGRIMTKDLSDDHAIVPLLEDPLAEMQDFPMPGQYGAPSIFGAPLEIELETLSSDSSDSSGSSEESSEDNSDEAKALDIDFSPSEQNDQARFFYRAVAGNHAMQGDAHFESEQYEAAINAYKDALQFLGYIDDAGRIKEDYKNLDAYTFKIASAYHFLQDSIQEFNYLQQAYYLLGDFERMKRTDGMDHDNQHRLAKYLCLLGACREKSPCLQGQTPGANGFFDEAIAVLIDLQTSFVLRVEDLVLWAACLMHKKDYVAAIKLLEDINEDVLSDDVFRLLADCKTFHAHALLDADDASALNHAGKFYLSAVRDLARIEQDDRHEEDWDRFDEACAGIKQTFSLLKRLVGKPDVTAESSLAPASPHARFFLDVNKAKQLLLLKATSENPELEESPSLSR